MDTARHSMLGGAAKAPALLAGGGLLTHDGHSPAIAIVGGSPASALIATVLCQQFGGSTIASPSGESILALLRGDTHVDIILLDISMADMNGIVAVQLIRALGNRGRLPIVALTANPADATSGNMRTAGFSGVLVKPYSPRELFTALQGALARTMIAAGTA